MKELKLHAIIRTKNRRRIDYKNTKVKVDNILNRNFHIGINNKTCCTDVTYIKWRNRFIYLSAIISLQNNKILSYAISLKNDTKLVMNTFKEIDLTNINIVHLDHGYQYSSKEFTHLLSINNVTQSMSRIGNSLDNRPIKYWFSIIKTEKLNLINLDNYEFEDINKIIGDFVTYYNNERLQSNLNWMSPKDFEQKYFVSY